MNEVFHEWRQKERDRVLSKNALRQTPLKERIAAAKKHAIDHGQMNDAMWQYQSFSLTIGELLNAAERAV